MGDAPARDRARDVLSAGVVAIGAWYREFTLREEPALAKAVLDGRPIWLFVAEIVVFGHVFSVSTCHLGQHVRLRGWFEPFVGSHSVEAVEKHRIQRRSVGYGRLGIAAATPSERGDGACKNAPAVHIAPV